MFESIQDFFNKTIDKEKLIENIIESEEYVKAEKKVKEQLDMFIENIKDAKNYEEVTKVLDLDYLDSLNIGLDEFKLLDLATRLRGGFVPTLELGELMAFIELSIEHNDDERVLRLTYNYNDYIDDKTIIEDYFINNDNYFYITELATNNLTGVDYDRLVEAIIKCNSIEELDFFVTNISNKNTDISKVLKRIKELSN